jgi:hypothetical protein
VTLARPKAILLAMATLFSAITMQLASADDVDDQARASYTFGPKVKNLALGAKFERQMVNLGAPISVSFAITNFGPPIRFFRFGSVLEYEVMGTGPGGIPIRKDDLGVLYTASLTTGMDLPNGSTYVNPVSDIGMLYDFRTPGAYTFVCATALTLGYGAPVYAVLESTPITLDVVEAPATEFTFGPIVNDLALAVRLEKHEVNVRAPIMARFAVKNFGPPSSSDLAGSTIEYGLWGIGPDGSRITAKHGTLFSQSIASGAGLGAGEDFEKTFDLSKFYDFQEPGRYTFYYFSSTPNLRSNILTLDVR